jgi:hypothetical protein
MKTNLDESAKAVIKNELFSRTLVPLVTQDYVEKSTNILDTSKSGLGQRHERSKRKNISQMSNLV